MMDLISKTALYKLFYGLKLKTVLYAMMLLMGLVFLGVHLYTFTNYSAFINNNDNKLKSSVIKALITERLITHHVANIKNVAEMLASDPLFRNSFVTEGPQAIYAQLENFVDQHFLTLREIGLLEMRALKSDYSLLGQWTTETGQPFFLDKIILAHQELPFSDQLKFQSHFLNSRDGNPFHLLILPMGVGNNFGFLLIVTSPIASLQGMGEFINAEVEVKIFGVRLLSPEDHKDPILWPTRPMGLALGRIQFPLISSPFI